MPLIVIQTNFAFIDAVNSGVGLDGNHRLSVNDDFSPDPSALIFDF